VPHPRGHDRQRPRSDPLAHREVQAEIEFGLPRGDPLLGRGLERLQLVLVVRRAQVLDVACSTPAGMHDLHRRRPRRGPHRAHVCHQRRLRAPISAQIQPSPHTNPQVNAPRTRPRSRSEPSQATVRTYETSRVTPWHWRRDALRALHPRPTLDPTTTTSNAASARVLDAKWGVSRHVRRWTTDSWGRMHGRLQACSLGHAVYVDAPNGGNDVFVRPVNTTVCSPPDGARHFVAPAHDSRGTAL
jgi:hypothetical protein